MRHPVCNQQICENLFHYLPSSVYVIYRFVKIRLHLITILRIYMILPYLHEPLGTVKHVVRGLGYTTRWNIRVAPSFLEHSWCLNYFLIQQRCRNHQVCSTLMCQIQRVFNLGNDLFILLIINLSGLLLGWILAPGW